MIEIVPIWLMAVASVAVAALVFVCVSFYLKPHFAKKWRLKKRKALNKNPVKKQSWVRKQWGKINFKKYVFPFILLSMAILLILNSLNGTNVHSMRINWWAVIIACLIIIIAILIYLFKDKIQIGKLRSMFKSSDATGDGKKSDDKKKDAAKTPLALRILYLVLAGLGIWFGFYLYHNHGFLYGQPTDQAPRYVHNPDAGKPHERKVIDSYQTIQTIGYGTVLLKANTPYKYLVDLNISNGTGRDHFFTKEHADGVPLSSTEIKNGYLGPAGDHFAWGVYELKKTTSVMVTDYKVN